MFWRRVIASAVLVAAAFGISFALSSGGDKSDATPFPGKRAAMLNVPKSQLRDAKVGSDKAIPTLHAPATPAPAPAATPKPAAPAPVTHRRAPAVSRPAPVRVTPAPAPVVIHTPAPAPAPKPKPTTPSNGNFDDSG
jgi:hypothetical protein